MQSYYLALAIHMGSNAILRVLDGNERDALELATNAAHMAFCAYPTLRDHAA